MDYGIARNYAITTEIGVSRHRMGLVSVGGQSMGSDWNYTAEIAFTCVLRLVDALRGTRAR